MSEFNIRDSLLYKLYHNKLLEKIFHTPVYELKRDLKDCRSVLDLGCGKDSPIQYCKSIEYSVGVEAFNPSLETSKLRKIHSKYINENILNVDFEENSFDAVVMLEVIEHLDKNDALNLLEKANKWAKKKIIISTPNGFLPQSEYDSNHLQNHICGFCIKELKKLGFKVSGFAGLKFLYGGDRNKENGMVWIKKPVFFWAIIVGISLFFVYYLPPNYASGLRGVKNKTY